MTIGGVNVGARQPPAPITPLRAGNYGISAAGDVQAYDSGRNIQEVVLTFRRLSTSTMNSLKAALESTAKPGGTVAVTPDSGDDLGVGASGSTNFTYTRGGFRADYASAGYWEVTVRLLYIE